MGLNNCKLERKDDYIVFKALTRAMKESGKFVPYRCANRRLAAPSNYNQLIERCYISRERHPAENFYKNIYYWPEDVSCGLSPFAKLLYILLLVNNLEYKKEDIKFLKNFIVEQIYRILKSPYSFTEYYYYSFSSIMDILKTALTKIGFESCNENLFETIINVEKGIKESIPF